MEWVRRADRAGGGLGVDVALYGLAALFAGITAATSSLAPHRAWGSVAAIGYGIALVLAAGQWLALRFGQPQWSTPVARAGLAIAAFVTVVVIPLAKQSAERAGGRLDRAQEEVPVIEDGARRLLETGTPYLSRDAIAALPPDERLLGYLPYQPGMAVFGLPRAIAGVHPWTDARMWFALTTIAALAGGLVILWRAGVDRDILVRALQVATVLPICALTLATGGDDLPVLALCLLALALASSDRYGWSGIAVGAAAAMKLFAWPVVIVLGVVALVRRRGIRYGLGALGLPFLTALPVVLRDPSAVVENVFAFPFGRGLVTSPAASPLPGHLLATAFPGGRYLAYALLVAAVVIVTVRLVRRPPRTAARAAGFAGLGLLAATLLLPATRFGYLLYPAALLVWAAALVLPSTVEHRVRT